MEWLGYCRAGFEGELAQEFEAAAAADGHAGYARTQRDSGFVRYTVLPSGDEEGSSVSALAPPTCGALIFARQVLRIVAELDALPRTDRLTPVLAALPESLVVCDAFVEAPDSPVGEELLALCRGFEAVLIAALKKAKRIDRGAPQRLHLCFTSGENALLALGDRATTSPWRQGIIRLRFPKGGPSRSTLKLDEAFQVLLDEPERERWLKPGMRAVDLGAAPGGWTFQLTRRGMRVIAVDNGPMDPTLMDSGLVEHLRVDGFRYRPPQPVDWLVCDMVEQPSRVAALMAEWLAEGDARAAAFNLKLPMKKRYAETRTCLDLIAARLTAAGRRGTLRAKQLYHDREEITVVVLPA
jgi:23S rRNA (cytidine2498-2'-O)-methyltransferase